MRKKLTFHLSIGLVKWAIPIILLAVLLIPNVSLAAPSAIPMTTVTLNQGTDTTFVGRVVSVKSGSFIRADSDQAIGNFIYTFDTGSKIGIGSTTPTKDLSVGNYFGADAGTGNVVAGNLIPATASSTLGTVTNPWKELYVSSTTIYIGNLRLKDTGGNLEVVNNALPTSNVGIVAGPQVVISTTTNQIATTSLPDGGSWTLNSNLNLIASGTLANLFYINPINGRVGIGTASPTQTLDVNGPINATGFSINGVSAQGQWTSSSTDIYYLGGMVAIGTTTPGFSLDIRSATNGQTALARIDDGSPSGLLTGFRIDRGANQKWFIGMASTTSTMLSFRRNGTIDDMVIDSSGNVGIGTSTPITMLDVNGEIQIASTSLACATSTMATLRYNFTSDVIEFCNGTVWGGM
ncbi:MAG: hypothetical protein NT091_01790 [Candidatus Falkowbacteria bacterium]|nr:hypothetical protein [Candidatus Falkowbacteria bacterium]